MRKGIIFYTLIFGMSLFMASCQNAKKEKSEERSQEEQVQGAETHDHEADMATAHYQCPMKCEGEKTYPEPGSCPICKMDLKEITPEPETVTEEEGSTEG